MLFKPLGDEGAVASQLRLQGLQYFNGRNRQCALGGDRGFRAAKLIGFGKNLHPFLIPLWMKQFLRVQEVLPFAFSGLHQGLRRGEALDKRPG